MLNNEASIFYSISNRPWGLDLIFTQ